MKLIGARLRDVVDLRRSVTPQIDTIGKGVDRHL
jgi:hypothetical protein